MDISRSSRAQRLSRFYCPQPRRPARRGESSPKPEARSPKPLLHPPRPEATMHQHHAVISLLLFAMVGAIGVAHEQDGDKQQSKPRLPVVGRSVVATNYGIVAASQPLAARAGVQILERGGNAIDAAIAANATIGLMEPTGNGIGGDLFVIFYEAKTNTIHGLNSSGYAATGMTVDFLASKGITTMPQRGVYSVTVPGVVAGWDPLARKFGSYPFSYRPPTRIF